MTGQINADGKMLKQRKRVALLIETSNAYARGLLEGIVEYQRQRDSWSVYLPEQERGAAPPKWLHNWDGDGVIARIETLAIAQAVAKLKLPVVDVSSSRRVANIPWVETNDAAIARLAFDHLYERGFRRFAYCGPKGFNWSQWRQDHFAAICAEKGFDCACYQTRSPYSRVAPRKTKSDPLTDWLLSLPKPIGLLCAYDIQAQVVLDTCRNHGIAVPEEIAVLGVDNDPLLCDLSRPSLSSIAPDAKGAGFYAANLLDDIMRLSSIKQRERLLKKHTTASAKLLEPLGVIQRQSTDVTAVADVQIANAMRFIRDHACDGINVTDVLNHVPISRRAFEFQFVQATGKTPHEMISSIRLTRVQRLLQQTELSLEEIAKLAGFEHAEYMSVAFRKHFGVPPGRYRRQSLI